MVKKDTELSVELEASLLQCIHGARLHRHEFITAEHLLLCLLDNPHAREVITACSYNPSVIEILRRDLTVFIEKNISLLKGDEEVDPQPSISFHQVLEKAFSYINIHNKSCVGLHKKMLAGHDMILAMLLFLKDYHAVIFLNGQGITSEVVNNFVINGVRKDGKPATSPLGYGTSEELKISNFTLTMKLENGEVSPKFKRIEEKLKEVLREEGIYFALPPTPRYPWEFITSKSSMCLTVNEKEVFRLD